MPADVPELLTGGRPERYAGRLVSDPSRRRVAVPGPVRALSVGAAALAAVAGVAAVTSRPAAAPPAPPPPPVAAESPAAGTPISPAELAKLLAARAQTLPRQTGVVPAGGRRPSAAAARAAAASLVGRQCIPVQGSELAVFPSNGRWQEAEVLVNPPQTAPFTFFLTWTDQGYSYRYPQIPDACP